MFAYVYAYVIILLTKRFGAQKYSEFFFPPYYIVKSYDFLRYRAAFGNYSAIYVCM